MIGPRKIETTIRKLKRLSRRYFWYFTYDISRQTYTVFVFPTLSATKWPPAVTDFHILPSPDSFCRSIKKRSRFGTRFTVSRVPISPSLVLLSWCVVCVVLGCSCLLSGGESVSSPLPFSLAPCPPPFFSVLVLPCLILHFLILSYLVLSCLV